jgi:hypothetical protein
METGNNKPLYILLIFLSLVCLIGCSTAKDIYQMSSDAAQQVSEKILPDQKPLLKKRVLIGPIIDMAGINNNLVGKMLGSWTQFLGEDKYIRVITSNQLLKSDIKGRTLQYGIIIDQEQIKKAEEMGINVFVSTVLHPFEINIRKSGIWPYRKYVKVIELSMTVNAFDINSGTLILSINDSDNIKIDEEVGPDAKKEWKTDFNMVEEKLIPMIEDFSSLISDELIKYPWQGKITITGDKKIRINGGSDIGIVKGNVFEVFEKGEPIQSLSGREYFIVGQKVGEIKITNVTDKYSEGVPLNNGQFEEGQIVKIKR